MNESGKRHAQKIFRAVYTDGVDTFGKAKQNKAIEAIEVLKLKAVRCCGSIVEGRETHLVIFVVILCRCITWIRFCRVYHTSRSHEVDGDETGIKINKRKNGTLDLSSEIARIQ